jgi:hypothetical protein
MFADGHYYSPIPDAADLRRRSAQLWAPGESMLGVDLRVPEQLALLREMAAHTAAIGYPIDDPGAPGTYFYRNGMFPVLDAEFLFAALCHFRPARVIEVGSGFSSLVMADVNQRMFGGRIDVTCIEPYPPHFLLGGVPGITRLRVERVEEVPLDVFAQLAADDLLFIDSSHVSKTGSDVNFLFFEVLPRLGPGVMVHLHDIFLPDEYPETWVLGEGRSWNEQYLLRAFLQYNAAWEVLWSAHYMLSRHPDAVSAVFPRSPALGNGGSFWMRRRG